jgi:hypothetical protein
MTTTDKTTADAYNAALGGDAGAKALWVASVTSRLMGELVQGFEDAGLKFPNNDRCFNAEAAIYRAAISANKA